MEFKRVYLPKNRSFTFLLSLLLMFFITNNARAYEANDSPYEMIDWMADIKDQTKLGQLAIPGTHDSGAYRVPYDVGETQDWGITEQLNNGVRFLDIRIANRLGSHDDFEIRHGILRLGSFNDLVMNQVNVFLNSHPQETILMSIRNEDTLDIARLESDYIYAANSKFYQGAIDGNTELGDVRGKIVIFNRYNPSNAVGINWSHSQLHIQDEYNLEAKCKTIWFVKECLPINGLDYEKKATQVKAHLESAESRYGDSELWINFASANYSGLYIGNSASHVNPTVRDFFDQACCLRPIGSIVVMDYPNRTTGVIGSIIENSLVSHRKGVAQTYLLPAEAIGTAETDGSYLIPAGALGTAKTDGYWGDWGNLARCPENHYVFGYSLQSERERGGTDDTALNAIQLKCFERDGTGFGIVISSKYALWGTFSYDVNCSDNNNPVVGFDMQIESPQGKYDDTAANDVDLYCLSGEVISAQVNTNWGSRTPTYKCRDGQAVVGIRTRVEEPRGSSDDTALNGVRLLCADY